MPVRTTWLAAAALIIPLAVALATSHALRRDVQSARPYNMNTASYTSLFGGSHAWDSADWTASDDRVRNGTSISHLTAERTTASYVSIARFWGHLDATTLGGAGFASQRTVTDTKVWDVSEYEGIELLILNGDNKTYTFNIKDSLPAQRPDGRDESSLLWEADFTIDDHTQVDDVSGAELVYKRVRLPWSAFKATYRGREKPDADPLKKDNIRRFSLMCRSFFNKQSGDFNLVIKEIRAYSSDVVAQHQHALDEKVPRALDISQDGIVGGLLRCLGFRQRAIRL